MINFLTQIQDRIKNGVEKAAKFPFFFYNSKICFINSPDTIFKT